LLIGCGEVRSAAFVFGAAVIQEDLPKKAPDGYKELYYKPFSEGLIPGTDG